MTAPKLRRVAAWDVAAAFLALATVLFVLIAPPHGILNKADRAAFAVCHRIPERSFAIGDRPLPLCARCSGTYLGAVAGFSVLLLRGRGRAGRLPALRFLVLLALFLLAWAVDGANSFLSLLPGMPHLYEPHNTLRLLTGTLEGIAIAAVLLPVLNLSFRPMPGEGRSIESWADLAWLLVAGGVIVALVTSESPVLLYPLAVLSGLTIVLMLGLLNAIVALMLMRREGKVTRLREAAAPLLLGIVLAVGELAAIGLIRDALTARFGLPF